MGKQSGWVVKAEVKLLKGWSWKAIFLKEFHPNSWRGWAFRGVRKGREMRVCLEIWGLTHLGGFHWQFCCDNPIHFRCSWQYPFLGKSALSIIVHRRFFDFGGFLLIFFGCWEFLWVVGLARWKTLRSREPIIVQSVWNAHEPLGGMILCGWAFGESFRKKRRGWVTFSYSSASSLVRRIFGTLVWSIRTKRTTRKQHPCWTRPKGKHWRHCNLDATTLHLSCVVCRSTPPSHLKDFLPFQRKDKGSLRVSEGKCVLFLLFCHRRKCHLDYALWLIPLMLILGTFFQASLAAVHNIFPSALFFTDISYMLVICW